MPTVLSVGIAPTAEHAKRLALAFPAVPDRKRLLRLGGLLSMQPEGEFETIGEIVAAARAKLPGPLWDYLMGGAGSEASLARNSHALASLALMPQIMRDVRDVDIGYEAFGQKFQMPVMAAPIGSLDLLDSGGATASARAASAVGAAKFVSLLARPDFETIARSVDGPIYLQIYVRGDMQWLRDLIIRAEGAGYAGLALTVDSAVYARRDRDLANRFRSVASGGRQSGIGRQTATMRLHQAGMTWDQFDVVRSSTRLPVIIKGVMDPRDAAMAIDHGADAVYISNHGGRQLDCAPATIDQLGAVVASVAGRAPVFIDGGFMSGSDIVKALALGARAVGLGKLQGLALAAGGQPVLECLYAILADEIRIAMALVGSTAIDALATDLVCRSRPGTTPVYD